jgi:hypothetical protein
MSHGRRLGFMWGSAFGAGLALALTLHWAFIGAAFVSAFGVVAFSRNDTDALL